MSGWMLDALAVVAVGGGLILAGTGVAAYTARRRDRRRGRHAYTPFSAILTQPTTSVGEAVAVTPKSRGVTPRPGHEIQLARELRPHVAGTP